MLTGVDDSRPDDALSADGELHALTLLIFSDFLSKPFNARELVARAHLQCVIPRTYLTTGFNLARSGERWRNCSSSAPQSFES